MKVFRIRNWEKHFENHESRKLRSLTWLPVPNKHDGRGYRRVAALRNSVQVFCGWALMLQVASKMPTRGVLHDDDGALTASDLSDKTGFPKIVFEAAFKALVLPGIAWIEEVDWPPPEPKTGEPPGASRSLPLQGNGREQKGREQTGREALASDLILKKSKAKAELSEALTALLGDGYVKYRDEWDLFIDREPAGMLELLVKEHAKHKDDDPPIANMASYLAKIAFSRGRWPGKVWWKG